MSQVVANHSGSNALVAESHRAYFLFGYTLGADSERQGVLRELAARYRKWLLGLDCGRLLQRCQAIGSTGVTAGKPVWEAIGREKASDSLHQDLMPAVDRILHGDAFLEALADKTAPFVGQAPLRLAGGVLDGRFLLALSPAARKRLEAVGVDANAIEKLGAEFEDVRLYGFASGIVLAALGVRFIHVQTRL